MIFSSCCALVFFGIFHHLLKLSEALEDKMASISVSPYFELLIRFWLLAICAPARLFPVRSPALVCFMSFKAN